MASEHKKIYAKRTDHAVTNLKGRLNDVIKLDQVGQQNGNYQRELRGLCEEIGFLCTNHNYIATFAKSPEIAAMPKETRQKVLDIYQRKEAHFDGNHDLGMANLRTSLQLAPKNSPGGHFRSSGSGTPKETKQIVLKGPGNQEKRPGEKKPTFLGKFSSPLRSKSKPASLNSRIGKAASG